jgi:aryl-alcohol dehydrogenase-like predicted oxidoreductase
MQSGLLTGSFSLERAAALPANDWRSRDAEFKGAALERNLRVAEVMRNIAERGRTTTGAVAVAWTLAWPGVTAAIVGARGADQVDGWIDAATLSLTPSELDEIAAAIDRSGAGTGPSRPAASDVAATAAE